MSRDKKKTEVLRKNEQVAKQLLKFFSEVEATVEYLATTFTKVGPGRELCTVLSSYFSGRTGR
jgi:hypothetical protein